jgi:hypothetical protein
MPEAAALVTGAAQGIGEAIARRLARAGVHVCVADLDAERAAVVAAEIGGIAATVDVRRLEDLQAAAQATADAFGTVSILVNNAGVTRAGMLHRLSEDDWDLVQDVNLRGTFNGFRAVAPWLRDGKDSGRRIVSIASIAGAHGSVGSANYAAAKAGVIGLTKTMAGNGQRHRPRPDRDPDDRGLRGRRHRAGPAGARGHPGGRGGGRGLLLFARRGLRHRAGARGRGRRDRHHAAMTSRPKRSIAATASACDGPVGWRIRTAMWSAPVRLTQSSAVARISSPLP